MTDSTIPDGIPSSEPGGLAGWRRLTMTVKIGLPFLLLALTAGTVLVVSSILTSRLIAISKATEQAGTERMRLYKLASMLADPPLGQERREAIRRELADFEQVLEGLRSGPAEQGAIDAVNSRLSAQLQELRDRWLMHLRPAIESAVETERPDGAQQALREADDFTAGWDRFVQSMEQEAAGRLRWLHFWLMGSSIFLVCLVAGSLFFLKRTIPGPLKTLTAQPGIPVGSQNELDRSTRMKEQMAETIQRHIGARNNLLATGQEIAMLGPGEVGDLLRRIADRAAESLKVDLSLLMVHHPTRDCWMVEAASGAGFDQSRHQILPFKETPFANQALDSRKPVVVPDALSYTDGPLRVRDEFGAKSYVAVPLPGPGECLGVLMLLSVAEQRTFTEWDIRTAQQFASYASVAMQHARQSQALESESHRLQLQLRGMEQKLAELMHEVKAPAGRVAEFAAWLERDYGRLLDAKGVQYLSWIKNEGKDLAALAAGTLDVSRMDQQSAPLEHVDVASVIREIVTVLNHEGRARSVRVHIAPDLPLLHCRRIHVKQVFENLIENAVKYMGHPAELLVQIGWVKDHRGVEIFVRDNGMGIDPAMSDRIFLPFVRLGTDQVPGAGIGLSIVKTVVEQYQGSVRVEPSPGGGSTFYLRLPVSVKPPAQASPPPARPTEGIMRSFVGTEESPV
ncbi:MAG TPA: ATP-binding protein [Nitrospira sp.]|nr:ATP-binding protein [Nitrospira sp.]